MFNTDSTSPGVRRVVSRLSKPKANPMDPRPASKPPRATYHTLECVGREGTAAAVPSLPTHSNVWYVALGGLLAGLGSIGLAFGFDSLDTTLRTPGEVESVLNIPLLAALPKEANGKANGKAHGNGKGNGRSVIHVS